MKENIVKDKSFAFALRVVKLSRYLNEDKREFVLSKQLLRSGTAIGALVREAEQAETLNQSEYNSINPEIIELCKFLTSIIKSSRKQLKVENGK